MKVAVTYLGRITKLVEVDEKFAPVLEQEEEDCCFLIEQLYNELLPKVSGEIIRITDVDDQVIAEF
jgi:hypothetical protein